MSVELFRITDADVLRAKDVWESQCGMVELIGPQMATFHYHSASPFFVGFRQTNPPSQASAFLMHCRHDRERSSKRWEAA